ncbi:MAG: RecB family exonuclease [Fimbriimonas sp.]
MARKPTLSPSKISTYLACPVKYRWTYVDSRGRWYLRSKAQYSFGTTLHRVLERFHDSAEVGVTTIDEVAAAYEESWLEAGFTSGEEMAEAYGEGLEILERHVEATRERAGDAKTIAVEQTLRYDMGDFVLLGRIDRLDEHSDGTLEIVDYKTGRPNLSSEDVETDLAMSIYQLLLSKEHPGRPIRATLISLRHEVSASASLSEEALVELEEDLRQIGAKILAEDLFDRDPVAKPMCLRCDFLMLCRKHPEFAT